MTPPPFRRVSPTGTRESPMPARILVVDDYPAVRDVVATMLTRTGYVVECAENGEHALHAITSSRDGFHVLLTDLQMPPGMRGDALAQQAREHSPSLRVVVMTSQPDAALHSLSPDGLDGLLLHKPFTPALLFGAIRAALAQPTRSASTSPGDTWPTTPQDVAVDTTY